MKPTMIFAGGLANEEAVQKLAAEPACRKATRPMLLACSAVNEALALLPGSLIADQRAEMGFVLGTNYGELDVTQDFLVTLKNKGMARPFLFQNSLHHSTLGFLSQHFQIQGPGFTVTRREESDEAAVELGMQLIGFGRADLCVVCGVDAVGRVMRPAVQELYPNNTDIWEGAAALILGSEDISKSYKLDHWYILNEGKPQVSDLAALPLNKYHSTQFIEAVARSMRHLRDPAGPKTISVSRAKPDGQIVAARLERQQRS
jgi:hypothetical protein